MKLEKKASKMTKWFLKCAWLLDELKSKIKLVSIDIFVVIWEQKVLGILIKKNKRKEPFHNHDALKLTVQTGLLNVKVDSKKIVSCIYSTLLYTQEAKYLILLSK